MKTEWILFAGVLSFITGSVTEQVPPSERYWPQWRGPSANGVAPHGNPPVSWSEAENVTWKIEIPGKGSATPIVWEDRIFVLSAVPTGRRSPLPRESKTQNSDKEPPSAVQQFTVFAVRRDDGSLLWKRVVRETTPHEGTHATNNWSACSPVTDGERLYAFFGSQGLYCLSLDGALLWQKDLGDMKIRLQFGEGSSPVLYEDKIIVNWDHQGDSFILVLDKMTGGELWRREREEETSWSTPLVVASARGRQVVTSATKRVRGYDLDSGRLIWESEGMTLNAIPTPVSAGDLVFVTSGFRGNGLLAIRVEEAHDDITDSEAIAWQYDRDTPYVPSPLLYGDSLYFLKGNSGILTRVDARTGALHYGPTRLEQVPNVYASPVGAAGRIYVVGREGTTAVIEHGNAFKLQAVNHLEDGFDASPAIVDGEIYLRGQRYLYRISED